MLSILYASPQRPSARAPGQRTISVRTPLFTPSLAFYDNAEVTRQFLTIRDKHAHTLEDLFDFEGSPSLNTAISVAAPPAQDCTPK